MFSMDNDEKNKQRITFITNIARVRGLRLNKSLLLLAVVESLLFLLS